MEFPANGSNPRTTASDLGLRAVLAMLALLLAFPLEWDGRLAALVLTLLFASAWQARERISCYLGQIFPSRCSEGTVRPEEFLIGFCAPVIPIFGAPVFLAVYLFQAAVFFPAIVLRRMLWIAPLLLVLILAMGADVIADAILLGTTASAGHFLFLPGIPRFLSVQVQVFASLALLGVMTAYFAYLSDCRQVIAGLAYGSLLSLIGTALVFAGLGGQFDFQEASYWIERGRTGGILSDPNALGLFALLTVGIFLYSSGNKKLRPFHALLICGWVAVAILSGSRSFLLGLFLSLLLLGISRRLKLVLFIFAVFLGTIVMLNIIHLYDSTLITSVLEGYPKAVTRLMRFLLADHISESGASRAIFWQIAIRTWMEFPVTGVGFEHFRDWVLPVSRSLGIDIGVFSDNANSFYLGLLAEFGIVGIAALWISASRLGIRLKLAWREGVVFPLVFLGLLMFGPHFEFPEIAFIFALSVSPIVVLDSEWKTGAMARKFALPVFLLFFSTQIFQERGFHRWERGESSQFMRWSGPLARGWSLCDRQGRAQLVVRSLRRQRVRVETSEGAVYMLAAQRPEPVVLQLECGSRRIGAREVLNSRIEYRLAVMPPWRPVENGRPGDNRLLGVQVLESFPEHRVFS